MQTLHSADGERLAHSEGMASMRSSQQARWHPSRSTPADRVRIRELYGQEVHDWMFTMPEPALFTLLHRMMLADPDGRRIDLLSCILLRRLEASRMTRGLSAVHYIPKGERRMETKGNLEDTLFKLDLIRQAVVGIAHRGAHGDIQDADGETLGVERLIQDVRGDVERTIGSPERHEFRKAAA